MLSPHSIAILCTSLRVPVRNLWGLVRRGEALGEGGGGVTTPLYGLTSVATSIVPFTFMLHTVKLCTFCGHRFPPDFAFFPMRMCIRMLCSPSLAPFYFFLGGQSSTFIFLHIWCGLLSLDTDVVTSPPIIIECKKNLFGVQKNCGIQL